MFSHSRKSLVKFLTHIQAYAGSHKGPIVGGSAATDILSKDYEYSRQEVVKLKEPGVLNPVDVERTDLSFFKVLVAEDNSINQKILQKMLSRMGIGFKIVSNGKEIIEALRNEYFDLVLMDCYMPEMNGFDAARAIRGSQERFSTIPLIAFSAGLFDEDLQISRDVGMNDFLLKPVSYDQLRLRLREWAYRIFEGLPVLDTSALDKIRIFDDQHQTLLRSLFQIYSENTQEELYKMRDLVQDGSAELIRKKAHMLKSSAAQLGAHRFEKFCILMEHEEELTPERAKKLFGEMCIEYENSRKKFSEYCQNLSRFSSVLM